MKLSTILFASAILISCVFAATTGHIRNLKAENCAIRGFGGSCLICNFRYVVKNRQCVRVSDTCKLYYILTGNCVSCVPGASLSNGQCLFPQPEPVIETEVLPEIETEVLPEIETEVLPEIETEVLPEVETPEPESVTEVPPVVCYFRQLNINNVCVEVNGLCKEWDNQALCTSCYGGYVLNAGVCSVAPASAEPCWWRQVRVGGVCVQVSDQCATFDNTTALCLSCYGGYTLRSGVCAI